MITRIDGVLTGTARSLGQFQTLLKELEKRLTAANTTVSGQDKLWYRGHDNGSYTLTPSLYRYHEPIEKERLLFTLHEQSALKKFRGKPVSWERVIHMQHYNIPTRLLDWTADLWVAVFFALTAAPAEPCIYILDPWRLNGDGGLVKVPDDRRFDFREHFFGNPRLAPDRPLAVIPKVKGNPRLERQRGRFTVQGRNSEPLERQVPNCVAKINLHAASHADLREELRRHNTFGPEVFPDPEGVAQFLRSEACLTKIRYDESIASRIRSHLQNRAERDRYALTHREENKEPCSKGIKFCNLDAAYLNRKTEASRMLAWLENGPPFLFITGEAGMGKTNFALHTLLCHDEFRGKPSVFFSFKLYGSRAARNNRDGEGELAGHLYDILFEHKPSRQERETAQAMISDGAVVLALDGLDELARVQGEDAIRAVARELDALFGGSPNARVIITCRDHIFVRLEGTGALGMTRNRRVLNLGCFPARIMRSALRRQLGETPEKLVEMARIPLFYEMIRRAQHHWRELLKAGANRTRLEEAWFKIILEENGYRDLDLNLRKLGTIAGRMLQDRSDLINANNPSMADDLRDLLRGLSSHPFALFVQDLNDTYSFSHQSLREFVLAWCAAKEIKTRSFDLLKSSSSFDYEGHELYDRVRHLLDIKNDVIDQLSRLLDVRSLDERERNHLIRNLFEMLGELTPEDNGLVKKIVEAALPYLKPAQGEASYVTYKTRYNIARCLERIHWSAPRPYIEHIQNFRWWWNPHCRPLRGQDHISAFAVRGFHRPRQEATSTPPILYRRTATPPGLGKMEREVSDRLMAIIEGLKEHEIPEDGSFLGINSTLALIRWLPRKPDRARIEALLRHPHMTSRMKQNLFYALFIRYRTTIPDRFRAAGLFHDAGDLENPSTGAREAFQRLTS